MPRPENPAGRTSRAEHGANAAPAPVRAIRASTARKARAVTVGGGQGALNAPIAEQDQRVEVVAGDFAQNRKLTRNACRPSAATKPENPTDLSTAHPLGAWPIAALRAGQCRFACTDDRTPPEAHRFCGAPVTWLKGRPTSWCRDHLPVVSAAHGAGGISVARAVQGARDPEREAWMGRGWSGTGVGR